MNSGTGSFMGSDRFGESNRDDKPRDGPPTANPPIASPAIAPVPVSDTASAPFVPNAMDKSAPEEPMPAASTSAFSSLGAGKPADIPGLSQASKPAEEPSKAPELPKVSELPKPTPTSIGTGLTGISDISGSSVPKAAEPPKAPEPEKKDTLPSLFGQPKQEPPKDPEPPKENLSGLFGAPKQEAPKSAEAPKTDSFSGLFGQPKPTEAPKASDMPGLFGHSKPQEPAKAAEPQKEAEPTKLSEPATGAANESGAGLHPHVPKPVEVISAPETPMSTGTPAGGTPRPELKIAEEPVSKPEREPTVVTGVQEPMPTPKKSVPETTVKSSILNGSAKSSTGASPFASGALQQDEPKQGEKRKFEDDAAPALDGAKPLETEAKKPKIDEPATAQGGGANGPSSASAPAPAPTAAPAKPTEPAPASAAAPGPKKAGRPKKDKKAAAPVGRAQRKTRSQGPADASL